MEKAVKVGITQFAFVVDRGMRDHFKISIIVCPVLKEYRSMNATIGVTSFFWA